MSLENVFVCIAAPVIVLMIILEGKYRSAAVFVLLGMAMCLLSAYVNVFFANLYGAEPEYVVVEITPVVEEVMKFLPLIFCMFVFEPEDVNIRLAAVILAISFATFENICYLVDNGAGSLSLLLLRGFGTGSMHLACGALVAYGIVRLRRRKYSPATRYVGIFSILCVAIVYHGIFNVLLAMGGIVQLIGLAAPILTCLTLVTSRFLLREF